MKTTILHLLTLSLLSCSQPSSGLRIGIIQPSIDHFPLSLAVQRGMLPNCELVRFTSGWEAQEALVHGRVDAAIMPFTYAWTARGQGYPVSIISFFEQETDAILVRPGIDSLTALNGRRIGVLRGSTLDALMLMTAKRRGFSYTPVYFRSPNEILSALKRGDIEAGVAYVPLVQVSEPGLKALHWFGADHPGHPCCDFCVTGDALKSKGKIITDLLSGIDQLTREIHDRPDDFLPDLCSLYRLDRRQALDALLHTRFRIGLDDAGIAFEKEVAKTLHAQGYLDRMPDRGLYQPARLDRGLR